MLKNIKRKGSVLLLSSCFFMSSVHAMICADVDVDGDVYENIRYARPLAIEQKTCEINRHITNLIKVHDAAEEFFNKTKQATDQGLQLNRKDLEEQIHLLYGREGWLWNNKGLAENLWITKTWKFWTKKHEEAPDNLGCLENRRDRASTPEDKERVNRFHMDALRYIGDAMLLQDPAIVRKIITGDNLRNKTYPLVAEHMKLILKYKAEFDWVVDRGDETWKEPTIIAEKFHDYRGLADQLNHLNTVLAHNKNSIGILNLGEDLYCVYNNEHKRIIKNRNTRADFNNVSVEIFEALKKHKSNMEADTTEIATVFLNDNIGFDEGLRFKLLALASKFIDVQRLKAYVLMRYLDDLEDSDPAENSTYTPPNLTRCERVLQPFKNNNNEESSIDTEIELGIMPSRPDRPAAKIYGELTNKEFFEKPPETNKNGKEKNSKKKEKKMKEKTTKDKKKRGR